MAKDIFSGGLAWQRAVGGGSPGARGRPGEGRTQLSGAGVRTDLGLGG